MRLLFALDAKDYDKQGDAFVRPSVRGIIRRSGRVAMVHSIMFDYYKFPGGGLEKGETHRECLFRETLEETGLKILPDTVREYGYVHRIQKGQREAMFIQDNYYYLCDAEVGAYSQKLDAYEAAEGFMLEFVEPQTAIAVNRFHNHGDTDPIMLEREARVLEFLIEEKLL